MLVMNVDEWVKHRSNLLYYHDNLPKITGRRGEYYAAEPVVLRSTTDGFKYEPSDNLKQIVNAEFSIAYNGELIDRELVLDKLYFGDTYLLGAYLNLHLKNLENKDLSRNNIILAPYCCLCSWQLFSCTLFVKSRSLDLKAAGLSDLLLVNKVAKALNAVCWQLSIDVPHIYVDDTKIARRK